MDVIGCCNGKYDFGIFFYHFNVKIELEHFDHGLLSFYLFSLTAKAPEKLHIPKGRKSSRNQLPTGCPVKPMELCNVEFHNLLRWLPVGLFCKGIQCYLRKAVVLGCLSLGNVGSCPLIQSQVLEHQQNDSFVNHELFIGVFQMESLLYMRWVNGT